MSVNTVPERSPVERAILLRERGCSYRRIANLLSVSLGTAFNYVNGTYAEADAFDAKREHARQLERARLDRVIRRVDRALRSRDHEIAVKAGAVLIKASESRRKMDGLDAPTKTQAVEPAKEETEAELWNRVEKLKQEREEREGKVH